MKVTTKQHVIQHVNFHQTNQKPDYSKHNFLFILNTFNLSCMWMKILNICIICIFNWNTKDLILWMISTKDIWSIQLIIEFIFYCREIFNNPGISKNKPFLSCIFPFKFKFFHFSFWVRLFLFSLIYILLMTCIII